MGLYLITGGAGFIGSHLARALLERGDRVRVIDDFSTGRRENLEGLEVGELGSGAAVEVVEASIADAGACEAATHGCIGVFHEAAQASVPRSVEDPVGCYQVNVAGTQNLLEGARKHRVRGFVFAASSAAYGSSEQLPKVEDLLPEPVSPYASSKVAGEHLLRAYGLSYGIRTVSLRYFNVFGPRQADDSPYTGVIAIFARALLRREAPTIFGDGEQSRDFTYIDNVIDANLRACDAELEPGVVVNVGAGERVSLNQLYESLREMAGVDLAPAYAEERAGDVRHSLADLGRARALLGYEPRVGWREGLRRTFEWYRARLEG